MKQWMKKWVLALGIALCMSVCAVTSAQVNVMAANWEVKVKNKEEDAKVDIYQKIVSAGDTIQCYRANNAGSIIYYEKTGEEIDKLYDLTGSSNLPGQPTSYDVAEYPADGPSAGNFRGWRIIHIKADMCGLKEISFQAVEWVTSDITYMLDGGTNPSSNPASYLEETEDIALADASKTGYTFDGWYTDAAYTAKVTEISKTQTGPVTLYAKFTPLSYPISYDLSGGTNGANPQEYTCGTGVGSLADASKEGYTFAGWYTDAAYTAKVTEISKTQSGSVTLYAKFTPLSYPISYDLSGGTNGANPQEYTYGTGVGSLADASKEGYTFAGWYTDAAYTAKVTEISKTQSGSVTLYAKFTPLSYPISYDLSGGTNGANPQEYTYGTGVGSLADASKAGYTFAGWYTDAAYTTKITAILPTQVGAVTLYAKFTSAETPVKDAWVLEDESWYYYGENGETLTGWQEIHGSWYRLMKMGKWQRMNGLEATM